MTIESTEVVHGWKATNADLTCQGYQFTPGVEAAIDGDPILCERGFHFTEDPLDVLRYYRPGTSRFFEVTAQGVPAQAGDDTKRVSSRLTLGVEVDLPGLIRASIEYRVKRAGKPVKGGTSRKDNGAATASGESGAATASGWSGAATASGESGAATASGEYGAATASGWSGAATASGESGAATASGWSGAATASGWSGAATASGEYGAATASGKSGAATASGESGAATASGKSGAATASGKSGAATASGESGAATASGESGAATASGESGAATANHAQAIAHADGPYSKARGILGSWLTLSEWKQNADWTWERVTVLAVKVDGKAIKADTCYTVKAGKVVTA